LRKTAEKLLMNQLKRATLDAAGKHAAQAAVQKHNRDMAKQQRVQRGGTGARPRTRRQFKKQKVAPAEQAVSTSSHLSDDALVDAVDAWKDDSEPDAPSAPVASDCNAHEAASLSDQHDGGEGSQQEARQQDAEAEKLAAALRHKKGKWSVPSVREPPLPLPGTDERIGSRDLMAHANPAVQGGARQPAGYTAGVLLGNRDALRQQSASEHGPRACPAAALLPNDRNATQDGEGPTKGVAPLDDGSPGAPDREGGMPQGLPADEKEELNMAIAASLEVQVAVLRAVQCAHL
jgi:hypothetical protein